MASGSRAGVTSTALVALACLALAAFVDGASDSDRDPPSEPLLALRPSAEVLRVDPLSLARLGDGAHLGEYHDTYSFSPDRSAIAFGISAPDENPMGEGRIGVWILDATDLSVIGEVSTGIFADHVAWLRPRRLLVLLGDDVLTVDPRTTEVLDERRAPSLCGAIEARERALITLNGRRISIAEAKGKVRKRRLPRPFARCAELAVSPDSSHAFAVADDGETVAEIALGGPRLAVHRFPPGPGGEFKVLALDRERLVVAHRGEARDVEILDIESERRTTVDPHAGAAGVGEGTLLTIDGARSSRSSRTGVRGFSASGRRRFRLLRGERVHDLEVAERFAYALYGKSVAVIDIRSGSIVSRAKTDFRGSLLTQQGPLRAVVQSVRAASVR